MRRQVSRLRRQASCYSSGLVRPPRLVVGSVLTAALALVALPGLAGSRAPSPIEPVPAAAFQQLTIPADDSRSTVSIGPLDAAFISDGSLAADSAIVEPAPLEADAAPLPRAGGIANPAPREAAAAPAPRPGGAQPSAGSRSVPKPPKGARSA